MRRKEPWSKTELAIDTEEAKGINQTLVSRLGSAIAGWRRLQREAEEHLGIDIQPLCDAFDAENRGYLPRGMVHVWIEPLIAHFTQHACWDGPALEPVCAYARSLYVIGAALQYRRMEEWRTPVLNQIARRAASAREAMKELMAEDERLRAAISADGQEHVEKADVLQEIAAHARFQEKYAEQCDDAIRWHTGAAHLLADRADARPSLVFAEAELLAVAAIKHRRVSELIVEKWNTSDRAKQVRRRARLDTYELRLRVERKKPQRDQNAGPRSSPP